MYLSDVVKKEYRYRLLERNNKDEQFNKKGIKARPSKVVLFSLGFVVIMSFLVSAG